MRYLPLSATTLAVLLAGTTSPVMAKSLNDNQIFSQYARLCILISDGSVRAYEVGDGADGALATPCDPATEIEVITNPPRAGAQGEPGDAGPAGPQGPVGEPPPQLPPSPPPPPP